MSNSRNSKYSNRAMQQVNINSEKARLVKLKDSFPENSLERKVFEESIVKIENEKQLFKDYVMKVDNCIIRKWLMVVYINKTINLINDSSERRAFDRYRKDNPIENPYNPQQVEQAKKFLYKALSKKENHSVLDLEKAISNLDDSVCRVIARLHFIEKKIKPEIEKTLGFARGSSIRSLKGYFLK